MNIWGEIKKAVNTDLSTPINHLIWLNDYKTFGEDSYVFQNKDILHELYKNYEFCMKDLAMQDEIIAYYDSLGEVNKPLSLILDNEAYSDLLSKGTFKAMTQDYDILFKALSVDITRDNILRRGYVDEIVNNPNYMTTLLNDTALLTKVCNNDFMMTKLTTNPNAIVAFAKSKAPWANKKPFLLKVNEDKKYIENIFDIINDTTYFNYKWSNTYTDTYRAEPPNEHTSVTNNLNESYAGGGIIAFAISRGDTANDKIIAKVTVNNDDVKVIYETNKSGSYSFYKSNINALAIPTAKFYRGIYPMYGVAVYIAK